MTTIRQLIQTSPTKANELLAKLTDTSDNAVKTRERLFSELKAEMELLASLEEEHLFPVLRKHKATKELVADALADNKQARKLLSELERTPKESTEFTDKVSELKRVFQQHVRDEKKELLPAVLKALSDEEAQAIVDKIEAEKAGIEEAKRAETGERRAEARRAREEVENLQQTAESLANTVWAVPQAARQVVQTARGTIGSGLGTMTDLAQRSTDQVLDVLNRSGEKSHEVAERSSQTFAAVTGVGAALTRGFQDLSREWLDLVQERARKNVETLTALTQCRSLPDVMAVQSDLVRDGLQQTIEGTRRFAEVSTRVVKEANKTLEAETADRRGRAA